MNPDIMYLHEAMKAPDQDQFKRAMDKELQDHIARRHWEVVSRGEVPKGTRVLDMVGHVTQEVHQYTQGLQMEGTAQHTEWSAATRH